MKAIFVLVGLLVTTAVAAQLHTAPPNATLAQPGQTQVSPTAHLDDEVVTDPQFELLRREIRQLKNNQAEQGEEIAHLRHCVAELVAVSHTFQTKGGASLAGTMQAKADDDDDNDLATAIATPKPRPKAADLGGCD
jgi:hypothetical protein